MRSLEPETRRLPRARVSGNTLFPRTWKLPSCPLGPASRCPVLPSLGTGAGGAVGRSAVLCVGRLPASGKPSLSVSAFRLGSGPKRTPLLGPLPLQAPSRQGCPSLARVPPGACGDHRQAVGRAKGLLVPAGPHEERVRCLHLQQALSRAQALRGPLVSALRGQ